MELKIPMDGEDYRGMKRLCTSKLNALKTTAIIQCFVALVLVAGFFFKYFF